jgi:hypothetical protein
MIRRPSSYRTTVGYDFSDSQGGSSPPTCAIFTTALGAAGAGVDDDGADGDGGADGDAGAEGDAGADDAGAEGVAGVDGDGWADGRVEGVATGVGTADGDAPGLAPGVALQANRVTARTSRANVDFIGP